MSIASTTWESLLEVGRQMAEMRQLTPLLTFITERALPLARADQGVLILLKSDGSLDIRANISSARAVVPASLFDEDLVWQAITMREPVTGGGGRSYLPLVARDSALGALVLDTSTAEQAADQGDLDMLRHFAALAAVCIQNALLNDTLEKRIAARTSRLVDVDARVRKLSQAVEQMPGAIAIADASGTIEYANPSLTRFTGYAPDDLTGQPQRVVERALFAGADLPAALETVRQGGVWQHEGQHTTKTGVPYWARLRLSPIKDAAGGITHILVTLQDITAHKQAEQALRESEERLARALTGGSHAVWDWDIRTGSVVRNDHWSAMLGYAPEDVPPRIDVLDTFCHPDDLAIVRERYTAHLEGKTPVYEAEYRLRTKSGQWRWVHDRGTVVERDAQGKPLRMSGTQHDITARKEAENALNQAHIRLTVLQEVDFELARKLDVDYVLRIALNAAVQLSGASAGFIGVAQDEGVILRHATGLYAKRIGVTIAQDNGITARVIRTHEPALVRDITFDSDYVDAVPGTRAQMTLPLMSGDRLVGVLTLETRDPDQFDDETYSFVKLLAVRIAIALDNARTYEELEHTVSELDAFADTVAHDLKNPLALVTGYISLVMSYDQDELTPELLRESLDRIQSNALKMSNIIDALLLLAGVRRTDQIHVAPIFMESVVSEVLERLSPMIASTGADITIGTDWPPVLGYAPWVEQVWMNYITNALKYGGEPPVIALGAEALPDGTVRCWVRDNGSGLTPEQQARVFKPFTRLSNRKVEGHGLGLSIVQRIITKLGGTVAVESAPDQGSEFSFNLPLATDEDDAG